MAKLFSRQGARARLFVAITAGVALTTGLAACTPGENAASADGRTTVLTTFTVIADMTREVAGDRIDVASITKPGAEVHGYEPTPSDLKSAAKADLILVNGLGLERWFEQFVSRARVDSVTLTEGVDTIPIAGESKYAGKANPHAWMSTDNGAIYVENIRKALTKLDPAGAAYYAKNAATYTAKLKAVGDQVKTDLAKLEPNQRALVTCEGAFAYVARDLGLTEQYLWPVNAEQQGTPQQIASVVRFVRDRKVPGVFCESTVSAKPMDRVASESNSRVAGVLYVDSLSKPDGPVPTYLELLRKDATTIAAGLGAKEPTS